MRGIYTVILSLLIGASLPAYAIDPDDMIALEEIERGLTGYGLTVVEGTRIDTFHVVAFAFLSSLIS